MSKAVFTPRANFIARASILGVLLLLIGTSAGALGYVYSSFTTDVGVEIHQPVPFSHQHHVAGLGIDCRFCHTTVETSAFAGMPATQTCMNCHSYLWTGAEVLAPVRKSWRTGEPLKWQRVHLLPDFVFFNHSIHLAKGVGCVSCHGRIDEMRLVRKTQTLFMRWCIDCHKDPAPNLRPRDKLFDMGWQPRGDQQTQARLMSEYGVDMERIRDCSICHR